MTPERIAELRRIGEAATASPWVAEYRDGYISGHVTSENHTYAGNCYPTTRPDSVTSQDTMTADDAEFIATARNEWAALLDELERLEAVVKKARNVWLFSRGYVSEGVEIPDDASEPALDAEEAARHLAMYRAIEAFDAARATAAAERGCT